MTVSDEAVERATHVYYQWPEHQQVVDAAKARFDVGRDWDLSAEKHIVQDRVRLLAVLLDFVEQSRVASSEEAATSDTIKELREAYEAWMATEEAPDADACSQPFADFCLALQELCYTDAERGVLQGERT